MAGRIPLFLLPASILLHFLPCLVRAYPQFTHPAAGASVQLPTLDVQWKDSDTTPLITELTAYSLILMVGGNTQESQRELQTFTSDGLFQNSGNSATGNISAGIAGDLKNGFFFKIVSTTYKDGQIVNFSDRFSIEGLTGSNIPAEINGVRALGESTQGPPMIRPNGQISSSMISSTTKTGPHTVYVTTTPTAPSTSENKLPAQSSSTASSSSHSPHISRDAEIGIGIAFGLGGLFSFLATLIYLRWRQRPHKLGAVREFDTPMTQPELPAESTSKRNTRLGFHELVEADHGQRPPEMDGASTAKFELEGDSPPLVEAGSGRRSVYSTVSTELGTLRSFGSDTLTPGSARHSLTR